jgi:dTDP-glucose 4,6-dehydratase
MNLLVTGGAGFIGSHFIRHTIHQPAITKVVNLDCLTYAGSLENVADLVADSKYTFKRVDLRDLPSVRGVIREFGITHVVHLAAESHVDRSIVAPADFVTTNILGTFNLLEACRELWLIEGHQSSGPRRFHHVSTDEVYGSLGPSGRFTEASPYAPNSPYSASKASSDLLVRAYHRTYGLNTVITNCSNNYGPYQFPEKLIPVIIQNLIARKPLPVYGDGLHVRDWIHVRDHAEALWQVLQHGSVGETYNIGGDNESTNIRLVELICDQFDELRPDLGQNSRQLITFVKDRPGHDRRYAIDATKVREEIGWQPAYEFQRGIRETIAWYLDNQAWVQSVAGR